MMLPPETQRRLEQYLFRHLHPHLRFGTASDRYGGWIGQIYSEKWRKHMTRRPKKLNGQVFEELVLPVETVREYFEHFDILEIDFTFYRPLLTPEDEPTNNYFVLRQYLRHAPEDALFLLKAPQTFFARKLRRQQDSRVWYEEDPNYLHAEAYMRQFHEPAEALLGAHLKGILFEQEYQRVSETPPLDTYLAELDRFFQVIPLTTPLHVELRSPHLLQPPLFTWLEQRGLGYAFSHWTYLPSLRHQWKRAGERFTSRHGEAVIRLLTPLRMTYAEAFAKAYPFDRPVPELAETPQAQRMIDDTVMLASEAIQRNVTANIIANNRAYGNAPALVRDIVQRMIESSVLHPPEGASE